MNKNVNLVSTQQISSNQVAQYLRQYPDFFSNNLSLLEDLSIPNPGGNVISLASKQLEILQDKHKKIEAKLVELIKIAKENDTFYNKIHQLTLALLQNDTLENMVNNLHKVFVKHFLTDFFSLRIIKNTEDISINNIFVSPDDKNLIHFSQELSSNEASCGRLTLNQAEFLFTKNALEVKSCVIIPMVYEELKGIIAIGSKDETRFHHSMGDLFLIKIREIISTRLITFL